MSARFFFCAVLLLWTTMPARADKFNNKTADFAVSFNGETSAYRDTSAFVLPRATMTIEAVGGPPGDYVLTAPAGVAIQQGVRKWRYTAPARPGLYELAIDGPAKKDTIALHVFVMVPAGEVRNGVLNGYRIGAYPATPLKGNAIYTPPSGFVEVTRDNRNTKVSPHFTLEQFLCKEDTSRSFPKYVVLKERLLLKLEAILERVNQLGFDVDTLNVMSAYRTPYYNHAIGDVKYSMHQWGSASDIYIDPRKNDRMEDLNRDGRVDIRDSKWLYDAIEQMLAEKDFQKFQGGMGFYPGTGSHPPFVHVDVRGTKARWQG
jgi:peptidase M15-like protein